MVYRDNVTTLAHKLGVTNNPGLREEDLKIAELHFISAAGDITKIIASDMNRGARLFLQDVAGRPRYTEISCNSALQAYAADYFAELWQTSEKRPLLNAIRTSETMRIIWK